MDLYEYKKTKFDKYKADAMKFLKSQCKHWKNEYEKEIKLNLNTNCTVIQSNII